MKEPDKNEMNETEPSVGERFVSGLTNDRRFDSGLDTSAEQARAHVIAMGAVRRRPRAPGRRPGTVSATNPATNPLASFGSIREEDVAESLHNAVRPTLEQAQEFLRELEEQPRDTP